VIYSHQYLLLVQTPSICAPVNVLPNTSSSEGTSSLGVVVLVIESFEASRSGRAEAL
jgi:hypothetical protein